jgi:hypothetical protein
LALVIWASSSGSPTHPRRAGTGAKSKPGARLLSAPDSLIATRLAVKLPFALQDAAAVYLGSGRVVLLGGLNAADTSTAAVNVLDARSVHAGGALPMAQHDAQAALLDGRAYVFGGGQFSSYEHVLAYDAAGGRVSEAASLPTPTSDAGVAAITDTAYVVGGYNGERALDTIVAWRPGVQPRVVGRLPNSLRYAAVAASAGRLVIAGGSREEVAASAILSFDPTTGAVRQIGELPVPLTHAAAVALGTYVYVLGGRGSGPDSQRGEIVAIDPETGRALRDGALPVRLSDTSAVLAGESIWLIGGSGTAGASAAVYALTPQVP